MNRKQDYPNWHFIPQSESSYDIHVTNQIENFGWLLEQLPKPFGKFDPDYKGRFVEVGAFDGVTYSNVWQFACAGWPGIMIEPMPENIAKCVAEHKDRPWVIVEPVGCGERNEQIPMFFEREGSRLASAGEPHQMITLLTLDSILRKHNWEPDFDMLVIDTEHYELPTLRGFDLNYWRPKLAIIETHQPYRPLIHEIFDPLYSTYSEDGLNTLFTRRDWKP